MINIRLVFMIFECWIQLLMNYHVHSILLLIMFHMFIYSFQDHKFQ
jgi:hypothetical protein